MENNSVQVIAEYIWLDSNNKYRSKTKIINNIQLPNDDELYSIGMYPNWSYDGSSCNDNKGIDSISECVLKPHAVYNDPFNDDTDYFKYTLVLCRNYYYDSSTESYIHMLETDDDEFINLLGNGKYKLVPIHSDMEPSLWDNNTFKSEDIKLGFEQEFFMIDSTTKQPLGFYKSNTTCPFTYIIVQILIHFGFSNGYLPVSGDQGPYYCGTGTNNVFNREFLNDTQTLLLDANINITGFNYEVAPGQAEFQVFGDAIKACNDLLMTRYILQRNGEYNYYGIEISFEPVVISKKHGKFNMSGCHTNISFNSYRNLNYNTSFTDNDNTTVNYINNDDDDIKDTTDTTDTSCNTSKHYKINNVSDFMNEVENMYVYYNTNKEQFESIFGNNNCNRCTGDFETSDWREFTWGVGSRDTSVRVPLDSLLSNVECDNMNKDKMYFEDRRPGSNVEPFTILNYWLKIITLIFYINNNTDNNKYILRNIYLSDAINVDDSDVEVDMSASNTNTSNSIRNRFNNIVIPHATDTTTDTDVITTVSSNLDNVKDNVKANLSDTTTVVNNNSWFRFLY